MHEPILRWCRQQLCASILRAVVWTAPLFVGLAVTLVTARHLQWLPAVDPADLQGDHVAAAPGEDVPTSRGSAAVSSSTRSPEPSDDNSTAVTTIVNLSTELAPRTTAGSLPTSASTSTAPANAPTPTTAATSSTLPPPPNHPPVAVDDTAFARRGTTIHIDVLSNDFDIDGDIDPLSVSLVKDSSRNTGLSEYGESSVKTRNGRNEVDYRAPLVTGEFTFAYEVCDRSGACSTASVRVIVTF
ncbi:MAG TPA: Ig-like domain-containing protein [Acidimicrobiales bacterium]|nr:Ig-like domain-containing protein [Acidimicrobiales bacterium]